MTSDLLHQAIVAGDDRRITELVNAGADPNSTTTSGFPLLWFSPDEVTLKTLLSLGANIDIRHRENGDTWLQATFSDFARVLLRYGANPNIRNDEGRTPIFCAIESGDLALVKAIVEAGAELDVQWNDMSPLGSALIGNEIEIFQYLATCNADPNAGVGEEHWPVLWYAIVLDWPRRLDYVQALVSAGADVAVKLGQDNLTYLHAAAQNGLCDVVEVLVARGADINTLTSDLETPLDWASIAGQESAVALIKSLGGKTGKEVWVSAN